METIIPLVLYTIEEYYRLHLFARVSGLKLSRRKLLSFLALYYCLTLISILFPTWLSTVLFMPSFYLTISILVNKGYQHRLRIFYSLFPLVLSDLFTRSLSFFVLPLFGVTPEMANKIDGYLVITGLLGLCLTDCFLKLLHFNFNRLKSEVLDPKDSRSVIFLNITMFLYYIVLQCLILIEDMTGRATIPFREFIVVTYFILFFSFMNLLDRNLRERYQVALLAQREQQFRELTVYNQQIEGLYRQVRSFRHDYANILLSLELGIENQDIDSVKKVYQSVVKNSGRHLEHRKFDLGRLVNINDPALKSLLSAKFSKAEKHQIDMTLEVPEPITVEGIELVDFLIIVGILCDNAIEAASEAAIPTVSIAFFGDKGNRYFIVQNSILEESLDYQDIFEEGVSSKGDGRGIGLYNVRDILRRYQSVNLRTESNNYTFTQIIELPPCED